MLHKLSFKQLPLLAFLFAFSYFNCWAEEAATESSSTINKSFSNVVGLETRGLGADVTIAMSGSNDGQSTLNISSELSHDELNKRIQISEKEGIILIQDNANVHTQPGTTQSRNYSIELPFFGKVNIPFVTITVEKNDSSVVVLNHSEESIASKLKVNLTLPSDVNLKLGTAAGKWKVSGDVKNNFELNMRGIANVSVENLLSGATVNASGAGKFTAKEIEGAELRGNISGSSSIEIESLMVDNSFLSVSGVGQINIKGGRITKVLDARISGSGGVRFDGVVRDLNASISGVGYINVGTVEGNVHSKTSGLGKINVGK